MSRHRDLMLNYTKILSDCKDSGVPLLELIEFRLVTIMGLRRDSVVLKHAVDRKFPAVSPRTGGASVYTTIVSPADP